MYHIVISTASILACSNAVQLEEAQRQYFQLEAGITFPVTVEVGDLDLHFIANADVQEAVPKPEDTLILDAEVKAEVDDAQQQIQVQTQTQS